MGHAEHPGDAHRSELHAVSLPLIAILAAVARPEFTAEVPPPEIAAAMKEIARVTVAIYDAGRRHALCELIGETLGPEHPDEYSAYVVSVEVAEPAERAAALELLERLTDSAAALAPRWADDQRN